MDLVKVIKRTLSKNYMNSLRRQKSHTHHTLPRNKYKPSKQNTYRRSILDRTIRRNRCQEGKSRQAETLHTCAVESIMNAIDTGPNRTPCTATLDAPAKTNNDTWTSYELLVREANIPYACIIGRKDIFKHKL